MQIAAVLPNLNLNTIEDIQETLQFTYTDINSQHSCAWPVVKSRYAFSGKKGNFYILQNLELLTITNWLQIDRGW